jgi:mono/diheme cytochrome c family protein
MTSQVKSCSPQAPRSRHTPVMPRPRHPSPTLLALFLALAAACEAAPAEPLASPAVDAEPAPDASTRPDATVALDALAASDAFAAPDATTTPDAGEPSDAEPSPDAEPASPSLEFQAIYRDILAPHCGSCHGTSNQPAGELAMPSAAIAYANLVDVPARCRSPLRVAPFDPDQSALIRATYEECGPRHPHVLPAHGRGAGADASVDPARRALTTRRTLPPHIAPNCRSTALGSVAQAA